MEAISNVIGKKKEDYMTMEVNNLNIPTSDKIEGSAFQGILDNAVGILQQVSNTEFQNNKLIDDFVQGKASVDDVIISTNKLTLEVSLATTIINTGVQTFKEIQQMQV
ncbi:MAG: flagellar hook-basal body complex protein FliE [Candidatus Margulisiibacteriota bacterium]|jgi:flagellar hook-basal body complex protein FliE